MSTAVLPRNWLRLIFSPMVPSSVKSGAGSPTSRAVATGAAPSIPASSTLNNRLFLRRFATIPICPSPLCNVLFMVVSSPLRLPRDLSCHLQDRVAGKGSGVVRQPPPAHDPLFVYKKEGPSGHNRAGVQDTIAANGLQVRKVAQDWEWQIERVRKGLLRGRVAGTDGENLHVQLPELAVIGLPGREVGRTRRHKITHVELEEDELLPPKPAQGEVPPRGGREQKVR